MAEGVQHCGDTCQRAADHWQEVDKGNPKGPQQREGNSEGRESDEHRNASDHRGQEVPHHVAGHRLVDLMGYSRITAGALSRQHGQQPTAHFGALNQQEHDEHGDGPQRQHQRHGALAEGERRLGQARAQALQLRGVLLRPGCQVEAAHEVADPATAMLRVLYVSGQLLRQMGQTAPRVDNRRPASGR
jgi:hypothetical protein